MNKEEVLAEARAWLNDNFDLFSKFKRPGSTFNQKLIDLYKQHNPNKKFHPDIINEREAIETHYERYPLDHKNKIIHFRLNKIGIYEGGKFDWQGNKEYIGIDGIVLRASIWHNYLIKANTENGVFQIRPEISQRSLRERWLINSTASGVYLYAIPLHLLDKTEQRQKTSLITNFC